MVNTKEIESFLSRGVENVFPSKEAFSKALAGDKKLSIYLGLDPTGPTLHMGHAIPLMKLAQLQKMGHQIILLIGDFTAMIGDPSDKASARKQLTKKEVLSNLKLYKKQAAKFLSFSGRNKARLAFNSKWLSKMRFEDVINLASKMTVQQMLERDMFNKRLAEKKPIYIHEFLYPLMQGYDSVAMDVDAEIGGNDQTFNMLAGRDLMRSLKNKEKFVVATKLLVDPSGKKMGKTEGNMITLMDSPTDMFGKIMSWSDSLIISGFELCTRETDEDIAAHKQFLAGGGNPRDSKIRLAHEVVALYYGKDVADKAEQSFVGAFSDGGIPDTAPVAEKAQGRLLVDILLEQKLVASKSEFRRLVTENAVKDIKFGKTIAAFDMKIDGDIDLKIGKHRFIKIRI
jgi:tyrosyl-tRNA synthetase